MAALLAEPQGHAPALHVMKDTEVRAARLPARALPLRTQAKMEPMEVSIASARHRGRNCWIRARARHVTRIRRRELSDSQSCTASAVSTKDGSDGTFYSTARCRRHHRVVHCTGCNAGTVVPTLQTPLLPQWQARMGPVPSTHQRRNRQRHHRGRATWSIQGATQDTAGPNCQTIGACTGSSSKQILVTLVA